MPLWRPALLLGFAALLLTACASHREGPYPTLEDYSDGVSAYTDQFLEEWKAGAVSERLFAASFQWTGPLPGDRLATVHARPPLRIEMLPASGRKSASQFSAAALRAKLSEIRGRFVSLGRTESVLFGFEKHGDEREIVLGLLLTGRGRAGELRQDGGRLRVRLRPAGVGPRRWQMVSGSVDAWMAASAAEPLFEEVAETSGLGRVHEAFLPDAARNVPIPGEHMPPGVAVLDFDGDGREDLYIVGGHGNHLYRNRGDGTYEDVTEKAGVGGQPGEAVGALAFDYDNDGHTDLYVTYLYGPNLLYRNRGDGTFEEVGARAGVALKDYCTSAAAIDYNRDGWPDLYVLVYGPRDRGPNIQANNAPPNHLFRNNGDGTFTDVSKPSHSDDTGWGLAIECADLDGDGWPDIYVANDFGNHTYLHNNGDGTFTNAAKKAGILDPGFGMGVAIDDFDGDG
ncbi:MAG TPA: VCBS repeat-containing protein, partial [Thermoanaerobaculia bacterium]